jgi:phenylacetate-CoA ligase
MILKSNKLWQRVYFNSPNILKNIYSTIYSFIVARNKFGTYYYKWTSLLKQSNYWDRKTLKEFQNKLFQDFILEIATFSSFYKGIIEKNKIDLNKITLDDLKKFPVINKAIVKNNYKEIVNPKYRTNKYKFSSSGTTGTLLQVFLSPEAYQREYAFRWHFFSEFNVTRKDRFGFFIGSKIKEINNNNSPFHIFDYYQNGIFFSIFHMSDENLPHYVKILNNYSPKYLKGYPSSIYTLALYIKKNKLKVSQPKAIFTASEVLHEYQKKIIEQVFNCGVFQWYGQVETTLNIQECRYGKLHVMEEYGFLEILRDDNTPVELGESGNAIATGWGNPALPLIRYNTGDNMTFARDQFCKCGRTGRIIERIEGRDEDVIITPEGKKIGRLTFIFMSFNNVIESQIIQNSLTEIVIKVVPENVFTEIDKKLLVKKMQEYIGDSIQINIELVNSIDRLPNGKLKHVVSNLN